MISDVRQTGHSESIMFMDDTGVPFGGSSTLATASIAPKLHLLKRLARTGFALLAGVFLLSGCGDEEPREERSDAAAPPATTEADTPAAPLERARCPATLDGCVSASGRILYVEKVDPDGDGDAHFVLASADSVTGPGLTVVDVRADLRPDPLPGPGDRISAAGLPQKGSYGQTQIEAVVVHAAQGD
jgi:hypothetical protein